MLKMVMLEKVEKIEPVKTLQTKDDLGVKLRNETWRVVVSADTCVIVNALEIVLLLKLALIVTGLMGNMEDAFEIMRLQIFVLIDVKRVGKMSRAMS
jgi:hypothetical protein